MPFIVFFTIIFSPLPAYAYLDPGSGNALIYLAVSLVGTLIYVLKNIFYKLLGKGKANSIVLEQKEHEKILIFSEGKNYWFTFKPIIEAFIAKKIPFSYLTMDIYDPALTLDNPFMRSKYIGKGSAAFAKVSAKHALVMLSTTPNIGSPNFPMPRPKYVQCLAHVCHGVGDISMYHKGSLDHYDAVLMTGAHMEKSIRELENLRGLTPKECTALGLPYLDALAEKILPRTQKNPCPVVLIAPSWGDKSLINLCGTDFIHDIAKKEYKVIIRPHPHSYQVEEEHLEILYEEFAQYDNVIFDSQVDGTASMHEADVLISDKSGIRFDFALLYERPVITIDAPLHNVEQYEYAELESCWEDTIQDQLGAVIYPQGEITILPVLEKTLHISTQHFADFREKYVAHFKTSGCAIAEWSKNKTHSLENSK